jgi:hypothetical protein
MHAASNATLKRWRQQLGAVLKEAETEYPQRNGHYDHPIPTLIRYAVEAIDDESKRLGPDSLRHLLDTDEGEETGNGD